MAELPLISVIIPAYNCAPFVATAVDSVLAQDYRPLEVIVVDDGSTDGTHDRLTTYMNRIRYLYQANRGVSRARNCGIQQAQGELIAFLDADDEWLPNKLSKQWQCLQEHPEASMIHTDGYEWQEVWNRRVYLPRERHRFHGQCFADFFLSNDVITSSVIVTRRCLEQVGPFDETLSGASAEDKDMWLRIASRHSLAYVQEPLVLYRVHAANNSGNWRKMCEDKSYVLNKALQANPTLLEQSLGRTRIHRHMAEIAFYAGYANADAGNLVQARRYFREALAHAPLNLRSLAYWLSTFMPYAVRQKLRRLKQVVHSPGKQS